jgi:hypothetical protein
MENITILLLFFIIVYIVCHYYNVVSFSELKSAKDLTTYHPSTGVIETDTFSQTLNNTRPTRQSQLYLTDPSF